MKQNLEKMYVFLSKTAVSIVVSFFFFAMITVLVIDTVCVIVKHEVDSKY